MTRAERDLAVAAALSAEMQARTKRETHERPCALCSGTGYVRDTHGEMRWTCVCGAAENKKGETE